MKSVFLALFSLAISTPVLSVAVWGQCGVSILELIYDNVSLKSFNVAVGYQLHRGHEL